MSSFAIRTVVREDSRAKGGVTKLFVEFVSEIKRQRCFVFQAGRLDFIERFAEPVLNKCDLLLRIFRSGPVGALRRRVSRVSTFSATKRQQQSCYLEYRWPPEPKVVGSTPAGRIPSWYGCAPRIDTTNLRSRYSPTPTLPVGSVDLFYW